MTENSGLKKDFPGKWLVKHIVAAMTIVVVLVVGAMIFLNVVTKHGQELIVPFQSDIGSGGFSRYFMQYGHRCDRFSLRQENEEGSSLQTEPRTGQPCQERKTYIVDNQCYECKTDNYA